MPTPTNMMKTDQRQKCLKVANENLLAGKSVAVGTFPTNSRHPVLLYMAGIAVRY